MRFARDSPLLLQGSFCSTHRHIILLYAYYYMPICLYIMLLYAYGSTLHDKTFKACEIHDFQNYKN